MSDNASQPATKADIAASAEAIVQAVEGVGDHNKYFSGWNRRTCGECGHWHQAAGEPRGGCYRYPPSPPSNNPSRRPFVNADERACGEFTVEAPPTGREKRNPETPGHAAKAARKDR